MPRSPGFCGTVAELRRKGQRNCVQRGSAPPWASLLQEKRGWLSGFLAPSCVSGDTTHLGCWPQPSCRVLLPPHPFLLSWWNDPPAHSTQELVRARVTMPAEGKLSPRLPSHEQTAAFLCPPWSPPSGFDSALTLTCLWPEESGRYQDTSR